MRSVEDLVGELLEARVRRVHVLAWRDLDDPEAGGSEIHADEFMRRWQEAGLDVLHRTSRAFDRPSDVMRHGYRVIRRGGRLTVFPRVVASEVLHRMGDFDALVEIWNGVPWLSPLWCRKPRITVLHHVHDHMWSQILPFPAAWAGRMIETRIAPLAYRGTETVTLCEDSRIDLERLGWPRDHIHIAQAGVDPFFSPGGTKSSHPSVLAVGRLAPVKRFSELLEQFRVVRDRVPAAHLTIVGEGPERVRLEQWIEDNSAHEFVHLVGRVDKDSLRDLYRSSWIVASASSAEGWGLTLTEAAGCGTPSVATDIGGHRSSVKNGTTGSLVSLDRLGEKCSELLIDHETRGRMGLAAQSWARSLSWDRLAAEVLLPLHDAVMEKR